MNQTNLVNKQNSIESIFRILFILLGISSCILMLVKLLIVADRGLDFIDEGFYLNWISNPWEYQIFTTQFGFVYHYLYKLVGEDLILFRQVNILVSYLLAYWLFMLMLNHQFKCLDKYFSNAIALMLASAALLILIRTDSWIATPSYNTLAFHGALIFFIGLLLSHNQPKVNYIAALIIGLGGWLVFMGKPPSAGLLAVIWVLSILIFNRTKQGFITVLYATIIAFLFLLSSALIISGSISTYIGSLSDGVYSTSLFDAGHAKSLLEIFRVDRLDLSLSAKSFLILIGLMAFLIVKFISENYSNKKAYYIYTLALLMLCASIAVILNYFCTKLFWFSFYLTSTLIFSLGLWLANLFNFKKNINTNNWLLAFNAFLIPYILAIGSNNNYWQISSSAGLFWLLSALIIIKQHKRIHLNYLKLVLVASFIFLGVQAILSTSHRVPYNQSTSLKNLKYPISIKNTQQKLYVRKDMKHYINHLYQVGNEMGLTKNTSAIDLTGHYGTALYLLDMNPVGDPYFFGGYAGSNAKAVFALSKVNCQKIARSWLLIEDNGYRAIDLLVLKKSSGIRIDGNYQLSKPFKSIINPPNSSWEKSPSKIYNHYLLKPINVEQQTDNCLAYRNQNTNSFNNYIKEQ